MDWVDDELVPRSVLQTCPRCEMSWYERKLCPACLFRTDREGGECEVCGGTRDGGPADPHVCPEPFPPYVANSMVATASAVGGIIVSQRTRARILLGLRSESSN